MYVDISDLYQKRVIYDAQMRGLQQCYIPSIKIEATNLLYKGLGVETQNNQLKPDYKKLLLLEDL